MTRSIKILSAAVALIASALPVTSYALSCGETITTDIILNENLDCSSVVTDTVAAIVVGKSGITIDLNGFTVIGAGNLPGISIIDQRNVAIIDKSAEKNSRMIGFAPAIYALRAHGLIINDIEFRGSAILTEHTQSVTVARNEFYDSNEPAVRLRSPITGHGSGRGSQTIINNYFEFTSGGIELCGAATGESMIQDNLFNRIFGDAIRVMEGSSGNRIFNNSGRFVQRAIVLQASNSNDVARNAFRTGSGSAISLIPRLEGTCVSRRTTPEVAFNRIANNKMSEYAISSPVIDMGIARSAIRIFHNTVTANTIGEYKIGIWLRSDTLHNDVRGNTFQVLPFPTVAALATPVDIIDDGLLNLKN